MINYDEASARMIAAARPLASETVELSAALHRILAQNVLSDKDMPPFNKAAMDGFACRREDLAGELTVVENIPAGHWPSRRIGPGECARIMTGAPVPEGADCVIMLEHTQSGGERRVRFTAGDTAPNICPQGEDGRAGSLLLRTGERITPAAIAVLASAGCVRPTVARQVRVGVMATGSELVAPDVCPDGARIRNSNSPQLTAQAAAMGVRVHDYGIVRDDVGAIETAVRTGMAEQDVLLLSGGVSAGDLDFVPEVLERCGFETLFDSVAMQPGRPTWFGRHPDGVYCCGLPGNPVSTFVVFEILVKPFLYRLMGHEFRPAMVRAALAGDIRRRKTQRQATVPVRFAASGRAMPLDYHGSAHIHAMSQADGLVTVPCGVGELPAETLVDVRLL